MGGAFGNACSLLGGCSAPAPGRVVKRSAEPVHMLSPTIPQGAANSTCFRKLARFYAKDVQLMFPSLYNEWGGDETAPAAAAAATREQQWRRSLLLID